jgi:hypothetical protein
MGLSYPPHGPGVSVFKEACRRLCIYSMDVQNYALKINVSRNREATCTVAALNIELKCNVCCWFSLSMRLCRVQNKGEMSCKRPAAIKGTLNHANTSFSTKIYLPVQ